MAETKKDMTKEPATKKVDGIEGVAMHGDLPLNHRMRAEALANAGKESDPDALISDELIADAKARLDNISKAEKSSSKSSSGKSEG